MKKEKNVPRILFAAPASGSGKTVVTCGVLELLKRRKISCVSYKCGPDYIDPMFHRYVLGIPGYNLDSFFLDPDEVRRLLAEKAGRQKMAVMEGAMGYYDGVAGSTSHASAYEVARITDTPVVLIVDGKKSSLSLAAVIQGFLEYEKDSHICGVIFNRTSSVMAERLGPLVERLGVRVYGAIPACPEAELESRHLGLTLPGEQKRLQENIKALADRLESCLDVDGLVELAKSAALLPVGGSRQQGREEQSRLEEQPGPEEKPERKKQPEPEEQSKTKIIRRIAIARDEAFCFYYLENLEWLEREGWELIDFSPLHDSWLPCGLSAILLGGGYPELYARELSENISMLEEIRKARRQGVKILAECGGFLYLHQKLESMDGSVYPMTGLIEAEAYRTEKLSRFGYVVLYDRKGRRVAKGHEFHYWDSTCPGSCLKAVKPLSTRSWDCMHVEERMIAGFPHLYYKSNPDWILEFLEGGNNSGN